MVTVDNLSFSYMVNKKRFQILDNISFSLARSQILCIVGPSGCGKTTLLFNIAGLVKPDSGSVSVDGITIQQPREKTAMIFQHFGLLPWLNVFDNVAVGLKIRDIPKESIRKRIDFSLNHFRISHLSEKYPKHLSGGEKQRVAIARAFVLRPDVLLLDEPFSAIDALTREALQEFLVSVWEEWKPTIIHVTHDIEEAVFLGTEILLLGRNGTIRQMYNLPDAKGNNFRNSRLFFEATSTLRDYMRGIIDETPH